MLKPLVISSAAARAAPDLLKALAILSIQDLQLLRRPKTILEIGKKATLL